MFLSLEIEDFATCKAISGTEFFYKLADGRPNQFVDTSGYLRDVYKSVGTYTCLPWGTVFCDSKVFYGGWSRDYMLYNGFIAEPPSWGKFFYDGLNVDHQSFVYEYQVHCQWEGEPHRVVRACRHRKFEGGAIRILSVPHTSAAFSGSIRIGTEHVQSGYYDVPGYRSGICGQGWVCVPVFGECNPYIDYDVTEDIDEDGLRMLSPFDMHFTENDGVGNTFISYDEETDSLIKGVHYRRGEGPWSWRITFRSSECDEREIQGEIKEFLSKSQYFNIEAIMFI